MEVEVEIMGLEEESRQHGKNERTCRIQNHIINLMCLSIDTIFLNFH